MLPESSSPAPHLPHYDGRVLQRESAAVFNLAREVISRKDPEWYDQTPIEAVNASWQTREDESYGEPVLAFLGKASSG